MDKQNSLKASDCALPSHPEKPKDDGWSNFRKEIFGDPKGPKLNVIDGKAYIDSETENSYSHSKLNPMPLPKVDIVFEPIRDHKVPGHNPDDAVKGNQGGKSNEVHRC